MKIYTKQGDAGNTAMYGGGTVAKADLRMNALGDVDELNAHIGLCIAELQSNTPDVLQKTQHNLFAIGAIISCNPDAKNKRSLPIFPSDSIIELENEIDKMDAELSPLQNFILPGGSKNVSLIHITRAVCRRAERSCVALDKNTKLENQNIIPYLNRLSDYFFVLARYVCKKNNIDEIIWEK